MRTYDNLRQKKQLLTEALADIFEKKAIEHTQTFWNIIFCRIERRINYEEEESSDSDDEDWEESELPYEEYLRRKKIARGVKFEQR